MSERKLELSYHPALKQVKFRKWENGGWTGYITPEDKSILFKYITSSREGIILEHMGSDFFDDLGVSMYGKEDITMDRLEKILLHFKGPRLDYGELEGMIKHYNDQNKRFSFSIEEFTELKDMESLYQDIQNFSKDIIDALEKASENDVLKDNKKEIQNHITDLLNKKKKLDDNTVNLCFVGKYSSGKSTLINAILGYKILPEAIPSVTAKMFCISDVENINNASISFSIVRKKERRCVKLRWDEVAKIFCFHTQIHGSEIGEDIQNCIKDNGDKPIRTQLREILTMINEKPNLPDSDSSEEPCEYIIEGIINVGFPIPLRCGDIKFTIYDTPGTDSNYCDHLRILKRALEKQTHSILMFMLHPANIEGAANALIIGLLDDIKENASKNTIDVGRSFFIVNWADAIGKKEITDTIESEIKYEYKSEKGTPEKNVIPLRDRRLFFTSAKAAYLARASMKGIATDDEVDGLREFESKIITSKTAGFYRYNRMALSEYNTEEMIKEASAAAEEARDNINQLYVVNSGLFSLEEEIKKYGVKFAMAVKAESIIDAVRYVINFYDSNVKALDNDKKKTKEELKNDIEKIKKGLGSEITKVRDDLIKKEKVDSTEDISGDIIVKLELSDKARSELIEKIKTEIDKMRRVRIKEKKTREDNVKALQEINKHFKSWYDDYDKQSRLVIEEKIKDFNQSIIRIINKCHIDDEAKKRLLSIPDPEVGEAREIRGHTFELRHSRHLWSFGLNVLERDLYRDDLEKEAIAEFNKSRVDFLKDYKSRLKSKIDEVYNNYWKNIETYSGELKKLRDNKETVILELELIRKLLNEIKEKKDNLFKKIWEEQNDG